MKWSIENKAVLGFALALLILIVISVISYRSARQLGEAARLESGTLQEFRQLDALLSQLTNAETSCADFIISGEEDSLKPYYAAITGIEREQADLLALEYDHPENLRRVNLLKPRIAQRLLLLRDSIDFRKRNPSELSGRIAFNNIEAQRQRDEILKLIQEMKNTEAALLEQGSRRSILSGGNTVYVIILGGIFSFLIVVSAITVINRDGAQRRLAEQSLRRLTAVVEATTDFVATADLDGRVLSLNKAGRKLAGMEIDADLSLRRIADFHPKWASDIIATQGIPTALQTGSWSGETALLSADGREIPVSQVIVSHKSPGTKISFLSTIIRDISERKEAQNALQRAHDELEARVRERTAELARTNEQLVETNRELQMTNVLLKTEQEASIDGILVVDHNGRILSFNKRFVKLWGISTGQLDSGFAELAGQSAPEHRMPPDQFVQKAKSDDPRQTSRDEIRLCDGRILDRYSAPMIASDGEYLGRVWFFRDITERKRIEEALRESEKRYRNLVDTALVGVYQISVKGEVLYVNDALASILAFASPMEIIAQQARMKYKNPAEREGLFNALEKAGRVEGFETQILTRKGEVKSVLISARREGDIISGIVVDISPRKEAEKQLQKSQARLQLQVNRMPIGCMMLSRDFRVLSWNPAAEAIFGFSAAEMFGKNPYDCIVPKEAQPQVDEIWRRLLKGDIDCRSVNENLTKDGRRIVCDWTNTPIRDEDGTISSVLSMVQDITQRQAPHHPD